MKLKENPQVLSNSRFEIFLQDFQNFDSEKIYLEAVERFAGNQVKEISKLKTEKGRKNRVEKVFATVDNLDELTDESKIKVKNFLLSELKMDWRSER